MWQAIANEMGNRFQGRRDQDMLSHGHSEDVRFGLRKEQALYDRARERGLTPQEYYGSSAPGSPGPSGGAQVLGNMAQSRESGRRQMLGQAFQAHQDRQVQKRGQDTQLEIAKVQAGVQTAGQEVTKRGQDISSETQMAIADKNYRLAMKKLQQIEVPRLMQELRISSQQYKKLTNEIATSTPKFQLYMKKLSMGVDNMMVEFLQHAYGIDITNPKSVSNMGEAQRQNFISDTAGISSHAFKEASGIKRIAEGAYSAIQPELNKEKLGNSQRKTKMRPILGRKTQNIYGGKYYP